MNTNLQMSTPSAVSFKERSKQFFNQLGMLIILVLLIIVMMIVAPNFTDSSNILNVLKQSSITAILAAGMTVVILTGGIDLSVGSILALSGVISVLLSNAGTPRLLLC